MPPSSVPEGIFREQMEARSIASAACTQEHLVMLKNETKTTMSYAGLRKTAIALDTQPRPCLTMVGDNWRDSPRLRGISPTLLVRLRY